MPAVVLRVANLIVLVLVWPRQPSSRRRHPEGWHDAEHVRATLQRLARDLALGTTLRHESIAWGGRFL